MHQIRAFFMVAAATISLAITAVVAPAANAAPPGDAALPLLTTADGRVLTPTVTHLSKSAGTGAGLAASCSLNGSPPVLASSDSMGMEGTVYFSALFGCMGVAGRLELTIGLQQRSLVDSSWGTVRQEPPRTTPSPGYNGFGMNFTTPCVAIGLGNWRGIARARLITDVTIYDWGWNATAEAAIRC